MQIIGVWLEYLKPYNCVQTNDYYRQITKSDFKMIVMEYGKYINDYNKKFMNWLNFSIK